MFSRLPRQMLTLKIYPSALPKTANFPRSVDHQFHFPRLVPDEGDAVEHRRQAADEGGVAFHCAVKA